MKKLLFLLTIVCLNPFCFAKKQSSQTYLLVHGAWHGAWCWNKVVPLLTAQGHKVVAIDLPGHGTDTTPPDDVTLDRYVSKVVDVAQQTGGKVVLVGHSMAGVVIAQAAEQLGLKKVSKLVFLDAFLPKNGDSVSSLAQLIEATLPKDTSRITIGKALIVAPNHKTSTFKPDLADVLFYHDCTDKDRQFAHQNLSRQAFAPLGTPVRLTDAVYGNIPKYYILCTESKDLDKTLLPTRVKCERVYRLKSSHSPFFSMPVELAALLQQI